MHELLAPLFHAVFLDTVREDSTGPAELRELCSAKHLGADSWILFDAVMSGVSVWYEWQESSPRAGRTGGSQSPLKSAVLPEGQKGIQPYIAPIVKVCNKVQNELLKQCDPTLWKALQNAGIEPQIYGM